MRSSTDDHVDETSIEVLPRRRIVVNRCCASNPSLLGLSRVILPKSFIVASKCKW